MEFFYGILLPKGFEDLTFLSIPGLFRTLDQHLNMFTDQPIYEELDKNNIIGKIKLVWIEKDGNMMIAGYLTKKCDLKELAIMFNCKNPFFGNISYYNLACSLTKQSYYRECKIIERRKEEILQRFLFY